MVGTYLAVWRILMSICTCSNEFNAIHGQPTIGRRVSCLLKEARSAS